MQARLPSLTLLLSLIASTLPSQQTWKVNCNGGSGVHFTDLPQAVAAATAGDKIMCWDSIVGCPGAPGLSGAFHSAPTIDKGISLFGFRVLTAAPAPGSEPTYSTLRGVLHVSGIPAGERVTISNIGIRTPDSTSMGGFVLSNCQGQIVFDDVRFGGGAYPNEVMEITNCADVLIHRGGMGVGSTSLRIIDSNVRMSWTQMGYGAAPATTGGYPQNAPAAIELINSTLTLVGSNINGPREWSHIPLWASPGILLTNSTLKVGPGTILRGGYTSGGGNSWSHIKQTSAPSYVYRDTRTTLLGPGGTPTPVTQDMSASYIQWAIANDLMRTHTLGPHDGFAVLMLSDLPSAPVSTSLGSLLIDPASAMFVDILHLPSSNNGATTVDYFVPSSAPNGRAFVVQSLTLSPAGELGLSIASPFTVAWEHGRQP